MMQINFIRLPRQLILLVTAFFVSLALAGCSAITLVPPYDDQIDAGLTTLYADTSGFVDKMIALSGKPEGTYAQNQGFYTDAEGRVDALIARAEAHRVLRDCPSTKVVKSALSVARIPADVLGQIGNLPKDDCQVVLFRLIRTSFETFQRFHEAQGARGIPASARGPLLDGGVGALLRAGITVEIAKRSK
jgi:hypothetical protein